MLNKTSLTTIPPKAVKADLAKKEDASRILELNIQEYGPDDILATPADFIWRYEQLPAGPAIIPVIRNEMGQVVGFIWVVPLRMRLKGQDILGATGTNLVIHPDYQKGFGYIKLLRGFENAFKKRKIPLHFSFISENKYQQIRQANRDISFWKKFFILPDAPAPQLKPHPRECAWTIPLLAKPLDFDQVLQSYFAPGWKRFISRQAGRLARPILSRHLPTSPDNEIEVQIVEQFDEKFDEFWPQIQDKYPVMVVRDRAFLNWRFAHLSGRQYHILTARTKEQMLGYVALRCATIRDIRTGLIMDFLIKDGPLGLKAGVQLMTYVETLFREQNMAITMGLMPNFTAEYHLLTQLGYRSVPAAVAPRPFRFASFLHTTECDNLVSLAPDDWFVTLADYESF